MAMNWFQIVVVPTLLILAVGEMRWFLRHHQRIHVLRLGVWLFAAVLICFPTIATHFATLLGIGRGTDLVFYGFALVATAFGFHLYGRQYRLRRDLVALTRQQAIMEATAGEIALRENDGRLDQPE